MFYFVSEGFPKVDVFIENFQYKLTALFVYNTI